jgi:hypothetical protein
MGAGTPLTRITLSAASVADDLGYVALADLAQALGDLTEDYRVIGGHMVTESAELIRSLFHNRRNAPTTGISLGQRLSAEATDGRHTRIRALISRVVGSG